MNLEQLQREVFGLIRQPLTAEERMRERTLGGQSTQEIAEKIIKPNDRLTSAERLQIYNQVYWFRILAALGEDFPGLCTIIGQDKFDKLLVAYLTECPSESFTLRNLGARLEKWLMANPRYIAKAQRLALDMVRLEWADIESFDAAEHPRLTEGELKSLGEDPVFSFQPNLILLDLAHPVDDLLLKIRRQGDPDDHANDVSSNVVTMEPVRRRSKRLTLPKLRKVYLAVHRQEDEVYFKRLEPDAFALLRALKEGKRLSEAIEVSVAWTQQKVEHITGQLHDWFATWARLGWFCRPDAGA